MASGSAKARKTKKKEATTTSHVGKQMNEKYTTVSSAAAAAGSTGKPSAASWKTTTSSSSAAAASPRVEKPSPVVVGQSRGGFRFPVRFLLIDVPLVLLFAVYALSFVVLTIFNTYYVPIIEASLWTDEMRAQENTYYHRECDAQDITTLNALDLLAKPNGTARQHADQMLTHGMVAFPGVLQEETAVNFRNYIIEKNQHIDADNFISLIQQKNRWSFRIGGNEDPSVPPVLRDLASSPTFRAAVDEIMGPDAALIEFTTITAGPGAKGQHWHQDTDGDASTMNYARSFVPMYSIFIPLQDTTVEMGATDVCPGTQICGGSMSAECGAYGFPVFTTERRHARTGKMERVWKRGDAVLMDLMSYHRGPPFTDPDAEHRVMLIATITNRPRSPFENSQIALGTSYSNRWDMWGLTLNDLLEAPETLKHPKALLRALGIAKKKNREWGWDYLTVSCSRIANDQMGFREEDVDRFIDKLTRWGVPVSYFETKEYEGGYAEFLEDIIGAATMLAGALYVAYCGLVIVLTFLLALSRRVVRMLWWWRRQRKSRPSVVPAPQRPYSLTRHLLRLALWHALLWGLADRALSAVANSTWGRRVSQGKMAESPYSADYSQDPGMQLEPTGPTTYPQRQDVLFGVRNDGKFLGAYRRLFEFHPGRKAWLANVRAQAHLYASYRAGLPAAFEQQVVHTVVEATLQEGRFLLQNHVGDWMVLTAEHAREMTQWEMHKASHALREALDLEARELLAENRYGLWRNTVLARRFISVLIRQWIQRLGPFSPTKTTKTLPVSPPKTRPSPSWLQRHSTLRHRSTTTKTTTASSFFRTTLPVDTLPPPRHWQRSDWVECDFDQDGWFTGRVSAVTEEDDTVSVLFSDGDFREEVTAHEIRRWEPLVAGDAVLADFEGQGEYFPGRIVRIDHTGAADIQYDDGDFEEAAPRYNYRRLSLE